MPGVATTADEDNALRKAREFSAPPFCCPCAFLVARSCGVWQSRRLAAAPSGSRAFRQSRGQWLRLLDHPPSEQKHLSQFLDVRIFPVAQSLDRVSASSKREMHHPRASERDA